MSAVFPEPPALHGTPTTLTLPPGRWWRVHSLVHASGRFGPTQFNDSGLGNARFSPLFVTTGPLLTMYLAASLEAALMETVLHDVPYPSAGCIHDLDRDLQGSLHASRIELHQPLQLIDLTKLGLQRMGLRVSQMFETEANDYPRTRRWAEWLLAQLPHAHGLAWMSARQPQEMALMLVGGARPADGRIRMQATANPQPLRDPEVTAVLLRLLTRLGCGVAPSI